MESQVETTGLHYPSLVPTFLALNAPHMLPSTLLFFFFFFFFFSSFSSSSFR
ncbi:hypothetical protein HPP92_013773 [Vanilla planifolia]|uniref:Uncharacterized protein n=1 Tax=Vanilla planifolia TaxID=51239 RepID=A0A835UWT3_VANPL|nr:hypothetical protein HPP92_013773 [Vanilla planifolia]